MDIHHLVKMANEIAAFFESEPDRSVVEESIASHLKRFWDPRMRRQLLESIDAGTAVGLKPVVSEAVRARRAQFLPPARPA